MWVMVRRDAAAPWFVSKCRRMSADRPVCCPRCTYDLRGSVATWEQTGTCPLHGQCNECGYPFAWDELLDPSSYPPTWSLEHAGGFGRVLKAVFGTGVRLLWPWVFWRRMPLHLPMRTGRLVVRLLVFSVVGLLAMEFVCWMIGTVVVHAYAFHYIYSTAPTGSGPHFIQTSLTWPQAMQEAWKSHNPTYHPTWRWLLGMAPFVLPVLAMGAAFPLTLWVLPHTRKRAQVQPGHLVHGAVYSLPWLALGVGAWLWTPWNELFADHAPRSFSELMQFLLEFIRNGGLHLFLLLALSLHWHFACTRRFRLQHPWAVTVSAITIAALTLAVSALLCFII